MKGYYKYTLKYKRYKEKDGMSTVINKLYLRKTTKGWRRKHG